MTRFLTLSFFFTAFASTALADAVKVEVREIKRTPIFDLRSFGGFVEAVNARQIPADINGSIEQIYVVPGAAVKIGQRLFAIRPKGLGSDFQLNTSFAPISGFVTYTQRRLGEAVSAGDSVMQVASNDDIRIEFQAAHDDLAQLNIGQSVAIISADKQATPVAASIEYISRAPSERLPTYGIGARIDCRNHQNDCRKHLPLGSFVRISIETNKREGVIVPISALRGQKNKVYVVDTDNNIASVPVKIASYREPDVELAEFPPEGSKIVIRSSGRIKEGSKVEVTPVTPK
jgi:multidrug efflux pump subunit AcrA (membrane-fusion protein)